MRFAVLLVLFIASTVAAAAEPSFQVLLSPGVAPCTVHVNGLTAIAPDVDPTACIFDWDFGDPRAPYDTLRGFNAAHCFDHPGSYTIQLTLTDPAGKKRVMTAAVVIGRDTRHVIFVSPDGSDKSAGRSPDDPARSLTNVFKKLGDDSEVLLRANCEYPVTGTLAFQGRDILIGRYGDGPDPVLSKTVKGGPILSPQNKCDGVIIQHLKFSTPNGPQADGQAPKVGTDAVIARGRNLTVRDCEFENVDTAVNGNGSPVGLLVQSCRSPSVTGLRAYMVWGQGTDQVYLGNFDANSTREHCIRTSSVTRQLIAFNTLANPDRRPMDKGEIVKGCIEVHTGSYAYIANNTVTDGDIRVGPYGGNEPLTVGTDWCVIENNVVNQTPILVQVGAHHIRVRNNLIHADNRQAILIAGPDKQGRISGDLTFTGNTAVDHAADGAFLRIWGKIDGITLSNNLYVAPKLHPGPNGTFFISSQEAGVTDFTEISNNVWPDTGIKTSPFRFGSTGAHTAQQWLAMPPVKGDRFENVKYVDPTSQPTTRP